MPKNMNLAGVASGTGDAGVTGDIANPTGGDAGISGTVQDNGETGEDNTPTIEELMTQLAQEKAINAKNKNALDSALARNGDLTKQLRSKMTAEEQEKAAKEEQDKALQAKLDEYEQKFRVMDYSKRYMGIGMDEQTAESLSEITGELSDPDKFFSDLGKFIQNEVKKSGENAVQKLLKDRPDIQAGNGDTGTGKTSAEEAAEKVTPRKRGIQADALKQFM